MYIKSFLSPPFHSLLLYLYVSYESYCHPFFKLIHRSVEIKDLHNLLETKSGYRQW